MKGGILMPSQTPLNWDKDKWLSELQPAGDWALAERPVPRMVMGRDHDKILWANLEPFMVVAETGQGKSTFFNNIIKAGIGLLPDVAGFQVRQFHRILYLVMDRPEQARHALARMIQPDEVSVWNEKVVIQHGAAPFTLNQTKYWLAEAAEAADADCVISDSLMNITSGMSEDEEGQRINEAHQETCRRGIQLGLAHHPRKRSPQDKGKPYSLDDVYGSKFIPGGCGSVLLFHSWAEDTTGATFAIEQIKSPAGQVTIPLLRVERRTGLIGWAV